MTDLQRASKFYGHVTGYPVSIMPGSSDTVALLGGPEGGSGGMIVSADLYVGGKLAFFEDSEGNRVGIQEPGM